MKLLLSIFTLIFSFSAFAGYDGKLQTVTAKQLLENRSDYVVLDVRTPEEYANGHIEGALNISHKHVASMLDVLKQMDKTIVVHCRSGRRALTAEQAMLDAGMKDLKHLEGDIKGWVAQELPLVQVD